MTLNPLWAAVELVLQDKKLRRPKWYSKAPERDQRIIELYRGGQTLEQVGFAFAITRERVRQILFKHGLTKEDGGLRLAKSRKLSMENAARRARKEARCQRLYGCGIEQFTVLNDGKNERVPGSKSAGYFGQMRFSDMRGIEWKISFPEWCRVWEDSGHFADRGRGADSYCMSRIGDMGPYSKENVRILTNRQNISEGYEVRALPYNELKKRKWKILEMREAGASYEEIMKAVGIEKRQTVISYACDARRWKKEGKLPIA